jgi:hypothetical protein
LLVLGLVFKRVQKILRRPARLTADKAAFFQTRYPINFVVKHPSPLLSPKRASPEAVETCRIQSLDSRDWFSLLPDRRHLNDGGDLEAANEFWWS